MSDRNDPTVFTLLSAVAAQGAGGAVPFASEGAQVYVYSAAGSSCTVLIQGSLDGTVWYTLVTLTDPAASPSGGFYAGTAMPYLRCNVSAYVSGTITAKAVALSEDPGRWNSIVAPSNTATALACTTLTASSLTATRVPFATTGGLLTDAAALTFTSGTGALGATKFVGAFDGTSVTSSALTVTRVPYASTGGLLKDEAAFTYTEGTNTLTAGIHAGEHKLAIAALSGDGAITVAPGSYAITKGSAAALTLAAPTATTHDGYVINVLSTTAFAHVITFEAGKINGGANVTITFGNVAGSGVTLVAYQGVWYTLANWGTTTIG